MTRFKAVRAEVQSGQYHTQGSVLGTNRRHRRIETGTKMVVMGVALAKMGMIWCWVVHSDEGGQRWWMNMHYKKNG